MITIKTKEEIVALREGGKRLARILGELKKKVAPGVSGTKLETLAREFSSQDGDRAAFLKYTQRGGKRAFPAALCLSINDEVVHGIPHEREKILKEGDIVSLDMGLVHQGLYTDMAVTIPVGEISTAAQKLLRVTEEALYVGIKTARAGRTTGDIGYAIEKFVAPAGYGIVRELAGHGVGYAVHEDPYVPNFGSRGTGVKLKPGMVIAIEPMLTLGGREIVLDADGFTYRTKDGSLAAHFEHTIVVTDTGSEILTEDVGLAS